MHYLHNNVLVIDQSEYIEDRPVPGPFPAFPMTKREKSWERGWPQGHKKGPRGQCEKWPQGPFLRPCGPIGCDASHQEGSRESGHKAIKRALEANAKGGP